MAQHRKPCWWVSKLHGEWWAYPADPTKRGLDERFETHAEAIDYANFMVSMGVGI